MTEEYRGFSLTNIEELEQQTEENSDIIEQLIKGKGTGIHLIVAPVNDHEASGVKCTLTAGENLVFGEVCYIKSDGKAWKADADDSSKVPPVVMALESITAENTGDFLFYGFVRDDSWNWTIGGEIYLNTTAGAITQTAPSNEFIVGIATHADRMFFNLESYKGAQHDRQIEPSFIVPQDGWSSGANNVYYDGYQIVFGTNSATSNHRVAIHFGLPDDYADGESITLNLLLRINAASATIDYGWIRSLLKDSEALDQTVTGSGQWTSDGDANYGTEESISIAGTNLAAGDCIRIDLEMEDNAGTDIVSLWNAVLIIPVNTRD